METETKSALGIPKSTEGVKSRRHLENGFFPCCLGEGRQGPPSSAAGGAARTLQGWGGPAEPRKGAGRPQ